MRISDWSSDVCSSDLAMTSWLAGGNAPGAFEIDTDGELRGNDQSKPTVRYQRHNLDSADIRKHIAEGKLATRLGLRWNNRSEEHTSELQSLMRISYAVFFLKTKTTKSSNKTLNNTI